VDILIIKTTAKIYQIYNNVYLYIKSKTI